MDPSQVFTVYESSQQMGSAVYPLMQGLAVLGIHLSAETGGSGNVFRHGICHPKRRPADAVPL